MGRDKKLYEQLYKEFVVNSVQYIPEVSKLPLEKKLQFTEHLRSSALHAVLEDDKERFERILFANGNFTKSAKFSDFDDNNFYDSLNLIGWYLNKWNPNDFSWELYDNELSIQDNIKQICKTISPNIPTEHPLSKMVFTTKKNNTYLKMIGFMHRIENNTYEEDYLDEQDYDEVDGEESNHAPTLESDLSSLLNAYATYHELHRRPTYSNIEEDAKPENIPPITNYSNVEEEYSLPYMSLYIHSEIFETITEKKPKKTLYHTEQLFEKLAEEDKSDFLSVHPHNESLFTKYTNSELYTRIKYFFLTQQLAPHDNIMYKLSFESTAFPN